MGRAVHPGQTSQRLSACWFRVTPLPPSPLDPEVAPSTAQPGFSMTYFPEKYPEAPPISPVRGAEPPNAGLPKAHGSLNPASLFWPVTSLDSPPISSCVRSSIGRRQATPDQDIGAQVGAVGPNQCAGFHTKLHKSHLVVPNLGENRTFQH